MESNALLQGLTASMKRRSRRVKFAVPPRFLVDARQAAILVLRRIELRDKDRQDQNRQDQNRQDQNRQDQNRQDQNRQDQNRQDQNRQDQNRQDQNRQDQSRQDQSRQDQNRQDQNRQDQSRQDQSRQDQDREDQDRPRGTTQAQFTAPMLRRLWNQPRLSPKFLEDVSAWLAVAGWCFFNAGATYAAVRISAVKNWPRLGTGRIADELDQVAIGDFPFEDHEHLLIAGATEEEESQSDITADER